MKLPAGFSVAGVECGIKSKLEDITFFVADYDAIGVGVYTTNIVRAANIDRNRTITPCDTTRAILINSGNANACTGERGKQDTEEMSRLAAEAIACRSDQVLVLSTGIIGEFLPMDKVKSGIADAATKLGDSTDHIEAASRGMLTTDLTTKLCCVSFSSHGKEYSITGFAKGSGMIGPNMATMLCVVLTDFPLTIDQAQSALSTANDLSFNCITVDGHTSTSDAAILLSSHPVKEPAEDITAFQDGLNQALIDLAQKIADDGEGASHLIELEVNGCRSDADARRIAKTVCNSALVKTAITGNDPNWGRIVSAAGYSGVEFDMYGCSLSINDTRVFEKGMPSEFDEKRLSESMGQNRTVFIKLCFSEGEANVRFWTCDLTKQYVEINSEYHT